MIEKAITVYANKKLIMLILVNEIDLGFIDKKIVAYMPKEYKEPFLSITSLFDKTQVRIWELLQKLDTGLKNSLKTNVMIITTAFELLSENSNKTTRNKRMLEQEGMTKYVKVVKHVGIEKTKYIRKR